MRIALLGSTGMLGSDIMTLCNASDHTVFEFSSSTCDIRNKTQVIEALTACLPLDYVINCAAYTNVDLCETKADLALAINGHSLSHLIGFCGSHEVPLVHFSTDYVFDGLSMTPYKETDSCNPLNVYGTSKRLGETLLLESTIPFYIFRVQWLYGENGPNFVKTISSLAQQKDSLAVVADQFGAPTWTKDLASCILNLLDQRPSFGVYHMTSSGCTNWFEFASYFLKALNSPCAITPQPTDAVQRPARRPLNGVLDCNKIRALDIKSLLHWKEAVQRFLREGT